MSPSVLSLTLIRSIRVKCFTQLAILRQRPRQLPCSIQLKKRFHHDAWPCTAPYFGTVSGKAYAAAASSPVDRRIPLAERPGGFLVPAQVLLEWRESQMRRLHELGDSLIESDGPAEEDLQRELEWLLDDAVAGCGTGEGTTCREIWTWRTIEQRRRRKSDRELLENCDADLRISLDALDELWRKRLHDRIPLQYLTGSAHWRDLIIAVGPGVLIPRPETELMMDFASQAISKDAALAEGIWADMGTGSGALAIGLAKCMTGTGQVWAVDISEEAAAWACLNVERLGVQERVKVVTGDWFMPLGELKGRLSGILSNPPYIPSANVPMLQAEVSRHEPWLALDGGGDGECQLKRICCEAADMLASGGFLALETQGGRQAEAVADHLNSMQGRGDPPLFTGVQTVDDFRGVKRFVIASRS